MNIIKHGDYMITKPVKTFKCPSCGCIFKANHDEYNEIVTGLYTAKCPEFWCEYPDCFELVDDWDEENEDD